MTDQTNEIVVPAAGGEEVLIWGENGSKSGGPK